MKWHSKRLAYGPDRRMEFNSDYFCDDHPFDYSLNYDCWYCESCGWHPVVEDLDLLVCTGCNETCATLNSPMGYGKHKGTPLSKLPLDYKIWIRTQKKH